jgi:hypothetical protein
MQKPNHAAARFSLVTGCSLAILSLVVALTAGCGGGGGGVAVDKPSGPVSGGIWLSWRAPSERLNGESLAMADLGGYRIYWGPAENPRENSVTVDDPSTTTYLIDGMPAGTYDVAVTAVDIEGLESPLSNTMTKSVD